MLSEMQKDVLTELVNVYIGQAASLLSEMVNRKIILEIPEVELLSISDVHLGDQKYNGFFNQGHIITSSLKFGLEFNGKAFLLFPADKAKMLVNTCLGELEGEKDAGSKNLMDTDFDVLKEISNVILNSIMGEFGNFLGVKLDYELPDIELTFVSEEDQKILLQNETYVLILHTSFLIADTQIKGVIIVALSMNSITLLLDKIDVLLGEFNG